MRLYLLIGETSIFPERRRWSQSEERIHTQERTMDKDSSLHCWLCAVGVGLRALPREVLLLGRLLLMMEAPRRRKKAALFVLPRTQETPQAASCVEPCVGCV